MGKAAWAVLALLSASTLGARAADPSPSSAVGTDSFLQYPGGVPSTGLDQGGACCAQSLRI